MRRAGVAALVLVFVALPARAHRADLISAGERVGPIRMYETTVSQAKRWFGRPTSRDVVARGCVRTVVRLRWGGRLKVYAQRYRGETQPIAEVHVWSRTITSSVHGDLTIHTRRGLRVDDPERKVKRLYPGARSETHAGHAHYIIQSRKGRVLAKVVDKTVVALEAHPYEWC